MSATVYECADCRRRTVGGDPFGKLEHRADCPVGRRALFLLESIDEPEGVRFVVGDVAAAEAAAAGRRRPERRPT